MTVVKCPCGQTYGTCKKHPGEAPEIASFLFIRDDGTEWFTSVERRPGATDNWWNALLEWAPNHLSGWTELQQDPAA